MTQIEYRRFKTNMTLLATTFTECMIKDKDLYNIADKNNARRDQDVALMYRNDKEHLWRTTGTTITGMMQKLIALAKYEKDEKVMAEKIRQLRDLRNAFKEMGIEFPEFLFGAIFIQCLEFGSFIREKLTSHMSLTSMR